MLIYDHKVSNAMQTGNQPAKRSQPKPLPAGVPLLAGENRRTAGVPFLPFFLPNLFTLCTLQVFTVRNGTANFLEYLATCAVLVPHDAVLLASCIGVLNEVWILLLSMGRLFRRLVKYRLPFLATSQ